MGRAVGPGSEGRADSTCTRLGEISLDRRFFALASGNLVQIISLQPDAEELEYRRFHTRPNLPRYREGYDEAKRAGDEFAARFYLERLPLAERTLLEATAAAEQEITAGRTQNAIGHLITAYAADPNDTFLALRVAVLLAWFGQDKELAETCARRTRIRQRHIRSPDGGSDGQAVLPAPLAGQGTAGILTGPGSQSRGTWPK